MARQFARVKEKNGDVCDSRWSFAKLNPISHSAISFRPKMTDDHADFFLLIISTDVTSILLKQWIFFPKSNKLF